MSVFFSHRNALPLFLNLWQCVCIFQLRVFALAESLGAVESLAECPSLMTHASVPADQRAILGIEDTLIRLSVGLESCGDLVEDLDHALNKALTTTK